MHTLLIGGLAAGLLAGCYVEPEEAFVMIESIQVDEREGNLTPNLEVEVHIYDFVTDTMLGCAELTGVQQGGVRYQTDAFLQVTAPARSAALRLVDLADRDVYVWVVERDQGSCPGPFDNVEDDIIGRTEPFAAEQLETMQTMAFEDVQHLRIGAVMTSEGAW